MRQAVHVLIGQVERQVKRDAKAAEKHRRQEAIQEQRRQRQLAAKQ